ncbi:DUF4233 domain-containing protein [Microcella flavibacter]|uniref:DUF4233 domain-containing protein n=1 Tax=Microcella flavibacter TaxID=1804990 RepID=UPI00145759C9|nr:DUF4233 domain-containing protein [Microcella flavibacter]
MTASAASPARPPRRERTATESLLSVVLVLEAIVVVFGMLVIFGLRVVEPAVAFTGGAVLILLLIAATRIVRYPWGQWVGHALQLVLLATAFLEILAGVAAAIFVGFWIWALVKGRQLDAAKHPS